MNKDINGDTGKAATKELDRESSNIRHIPRTLEPKFLATSDLRSSTKTHTWKRRKQISLGSILHPNPRPPQSPTKGHVPGEL